MRFAAGPATETEGGSLVRVLVADDDPVTLHLVSETVKRFGYDVVTATDGLEAQRKFAESRFPLVITDWDMPGPDGVELCRQIRNAALPSYTYIIFLTSRQKKHDLIEALSAGADDFISKPFHPQELKVRLRAAERILSLESDLRAVNRDLAVLNHRLMETSRVDPLMEIGNRLDFEEKISEFGVCTSLPTTPHLVVGRSACRVGVGPSLNRSWAQRSRPVVQAGRRAFPGDESVVD